MFNDNKVLGQFDLVGIPPAPRGVPQVEVSFDIDANGILHVNAKDLGTGKEQSIRITAAQKLSDEEIEKMKKQAEDFAEVDKKKKEEVEAINEADTLVFTTERLFKELEGKVPSKEVEEIKGKIIELKELLKPAEKDVASIKKKMDEINEMVQKMSTELYQKAGQQYQQQHGQKTNEEAEETKSKNDDNVVDADYEMKDEDEKKKRK